MNKLERATSKAWNRIIGKIGVIYVCDRWLNYGYFVQDVGMKPGDDYHLIRYVKDLGYFFENVTWADKRTRLQFQKCKKNKHHYTGVSWVPRVSKWVSKIVINGKHIHIGCFNTIEEAVEKRNFYIIQNNLPNKLQSITSQSFV